MKKNITKELKTVIEERLYMHRKWLSLPIYTIIALIAYAIRIPLIYPHLSNRLNMNNNIYDIIFYILAVSIFIGIAWLCTAPQKRRDFQDTCESAKLHDGKHRYPRLISVCNNPHERKGKIYTIRNYKIGIDMIDKKLNEATTDFIVRSLEDCNNTKYTRIYVKPKKHINSIIITPNDEAIGEISVTELINSLIVGATGTGKTVLMKILLAKLTKFRNGKFWILDYKQMDFNFLSDCPRYFPDTDGCVQGFNDYYEAFDKQRKLRKPSPVPCYLIIDEWGSLINALDNRAADLLKKKLNVLLSAGRGVGYIPIIGLQRADAEYFGKARDNFFCRIGLGNLSSQGKKMIADDDLKVFYNKRFKKREGVLVVEGFEIQKIEVDTIKNLGTLDNEIRKALLDGADGEAEREPSAPSADKVGIELDYSLKKGEK